jgi:hypothetical protein
MRCLAPLLLEIKVLALLIDSRLRLAGVPFSADFSVQSFTSLVFNPGYVSPESDASEGLLCEGNQTGRNVLTPFL